MKKTTQPPTPTHNGKGFLALAGEAFHVLGEEIVEGKDKVMELASEKFTAVKKAITKIAHKKASPAKRTVKKAVTKVAPKKVAKKVAPKKAAKKVPPRKIAGRKKA